MTEPLSRTLPRHVVLRACAAGLLVVGLAFLVFGIGFHIEGLIDLADGRMDGHAALDLSEEVATRLFRRRIGVMLGSSAVLLSLAGVCFWASLALRPRS
ncbi:MAG: hypothetical protein REJ23_14310 [Brevundimonas sp.]|nr:hypothetical protein [Brevundimonas sp.]